MDQEIIVQICAGCGACEGDIMAELAKLQHEPGTPIRVEIEECLDTCDDEPSFAVNEVSIAPANPEKLRRAVEAVRGS